ncbi:MAG: 2-oxo acid dehydrogenase subunit E2, partial [Gammaproteobacteria bacterium]
SGVQQVLPLIVPGQTTIMALGDRIDAGTLAGTHCLTLAYDHRVVNGTEAGAFLKRVSDIIEGRDAN